MVDKKEEERKFEVTDIPTQYGRVIRTPEGEVISELDALVYVMNELKEIKKVIG